MNFYTHETRLTEPVGNNAISYVERMALWSHGKLHIAQVVDWTVDDLLLWENIVFEEIEDGKLVPCKGLKSLLRIVSHNKTIYITDNHNHALYFRYEALRNKIITEWMTLLHIDQHADMNEPAERIDQERQWDLDYISEYVNTKTQIASFIQPALRSWLIHECVQIRTEFTLEEVVQNLWSMNYALWSYIVDIDIDFFAHETDIDHKISLLKQLISSAAVVTIATSPYFIDQTRALEIIRKLLS